MTLQEDKEHQSHDTNGGSHGKVTVSDGNKAASALEKNVAPPVSGKRPTPRFQFSGMSVEVCRERRSDSLSDSGSDMCSYWSGLN